MRFDDKRWLVQLKTHILPQDPHQTPVCKWSASCVLLFFTQNIRRTCTQGYVFNTINSVYWFIKGFLSETGILLLLSVSGSEKHCDDWQAGFPESWVTPRHQQFFLSLLLWKWKSLSLVWLFATCPWNSPGQNTGVGISLLQGIIPTQGLNPGLPHCRWILYQLSHKGSPLLLYHLCKYQHAFKRQISPSCCYENNFDFTDFLRNLRDPQDPWAASWKPVQ